MISLNNRKKIKKNAQELKDLCATLITQTTNAIANPASELLIPDLLNQIFVIKNKAQDIHILLSNIQELSDKYVLQQDYKINDEDIYKLIGITDNNVYILKLGSLYAVMSLADLEKYNPDVLL